MKNEPEDIEKLYSAIEYIIIKWSFIEAALDFAASTIYSKCEDNKLAKQLPKFLQEKCNFIAEAVSKIQALSSHKSKALNITGRIINSKNIRHRFAHSVLTNLEHVNGVYSFVKLDAKQEEHESDEWEFDVKKFPDMAKALELLARDAQNFAQLLQAEFYDDI